jgi:N-acyl homoserine lactone hydrolase
VNRFTLVLTICILILGGCDRGETPERDATATLRLYLFDCGMIRLNSVELFSLAEDETPVRDLIVPCYVIEHDKGRLLWDGGLPSNIAKTKGWHGEEFLLRLDRTLAEQLAEIELDMNSFDYVAFSHLHLDHCGVANEVEDATLIIQLAEAEAAFADNVTLPAFDPSLYSGLKDTEQLVIEGDYDVFGDGRVRIISAPGHTPGHQVLYVDLENTGPIVLSGDLYHFTISRELRRVPAFNYDAEMTLASMDRVETFLEQTGADLWIEHDLALFERLNESPAFYD